ncbi:MAG TPA: O-antigen ligase family protein [Gemmatimonadaceae bacterium]
MGGALVSLWFALFGADRFDFANGHGPFIATPFITLTPLLIASEMVRRRRLSHPVGISRRALLYVAASAALLCVVLTSVLVARKIPVSSARVTLLLIDVMGTFTVALLLSDRPDLGRIMARGALLCLPLFVIFNFVEALHWIGRLPEDVRFGPLLFHLGPLQSAGPLPRLAGPVDDANRAGYLLLFYFVVVARWEPRRWLRHAGIAAIVVLLLLTFSRSTSLAIVAAVAMSLLTTRRRPSLQPLLWTFATVAVAAGVLLLHPGLTQKALAAVAPISERVSAREGSAPSHVAIIRRGLTQATSSVPRSLTGMGYGNSYLVLQDYFPGSRYGNFHSLFVTMFAESGIFALLLTLVLLFPPLTWPGPWRALVAGSVAFNLFYQTTTEPAFWFILAAAWIGLRGDRPVTTALPPSRA